VRGEDGEWRATAAATPKISKENGQTQQDNDKYPAGQLQQATSFPQRSAQSLEHICSFLAELGSSKLTQRLRKSGPAGRLELVSVSLLDRLHSTASSVPPEPFQQAHLDAMLACQACFILPFLPFSLAICISPFDF
jgi:hypothetical protein